MASWQARFGHFTIDGWQLNLTDPLIRTQMESGPDRVNLHSTHVIGKSKGTLVMAKADSEAFLAYLKGDLRYGAEWITDCPMMIAGAMVTKRTRLSNFSFSTASQDQYYTITCDVEVENP